MMAAHEQNGLHGLTDPLVWDHDCVLPIPMQCAFFFITTAFVHCFPPLPPPIAQYSIIPHPQFVAMCCQPRIYELYIVNRDQAGGMRLSSDGARFLGNEHLSSHVFFVLCCCQYRTVSQSFDDDFR